MDTVLAAPSRALDLEIGEAVRLRVDGEDWLGPISLGFDGAAVALAPTGSHDGANDFGAFTRHGFSHERDEALEAAIEVYESGRLAVFSLTAKSALDFGRGVGLETLRAGFPRLNVDKRSDAGLASRSIVFGYQLTEFAMPVFSAGDFSTFRYYGERPKVGGPFAILHEDDRCLVMGPLNAFHDQLASMARAPDGVVEAGWHGDLERVPEGFQSRWAMVLGRGARSTLAAYGALLRSVYGAKRPSRYADVGVGALSYWTNNGGAYWYRSELGDASIHASLAQIKMHFSEEGVPVRSYNIDSWFYEHEVPRQLNPQGEHDVPPSGMMRWEQRSDMLPQGVSGLGKVLDGAPLTLHSRHFSQHSPYFERYDGWTDADTGFSHPVGPELFERFMEQAANWGAVTYEQDWLSHAYLFNRPLRAEPGRARAWQGNLDAAAGERGITLQLCMPTPMDLLNSVRLKNVTSVRTSVDYRYMIGSNLNWCWFLYVNALARGLGVIPYKDVFLTLSEGEGLDGDQHAELESLLAGLSAGPVGIGDRLGRTDKAIIARLCRSDGVLLKPDRPIAATDASFQGGHRFSSKLHRPLVGDTESTHQAGVWRYIAVVHASTSDEPMNVELPCADWLGADEEALAYDWRSGEAVKVSAADRLGVQLAKADWRYWVLVPIGPDGISLIGDARAYATAADRRVLAVEWRERGVLLDVAGAPYEQVELVLHAPGPLRLESRSQNEAITPQSDGLVRAFISLPDSGVETVRLTLA